MTNQDDNNQEIEKVEDVEVETTKKTSDSDDKKQNDDEYEKVCFICRRPESVAGKMIELPNHICVCNDCMQKSFDAMSNGPIDYSQLMNIPPWGWSQGFITVPRLPGRTPMWRLRPALPRLTFSWSMLET